MQAPQWRPTLAHSEYCQLNGVTQCEYQHLSVVQHSKHCQLNHITLCAYQYLSGAYHSLIVSSTVNSIMSVISNTTPQWCLSLLYREHCQLDGITHGKGQTYKGKYYGFVHSEY